MAEDATNPAAPGTHPDAVVINDDGSVTTRTGRGWVWVHDETTGARCDVPPSMLPRPGLTVVPGYPVNYGPQARPPKPKLLLGDVPTTAGRATSAGEVSADVAAARASAAALTTSTGPVGLDVEPPLTEPPAGGSDKKTGTSTTSTKDRNPR